MRTISLAIRVIAFVFCVALASVPALGQNVGTLRGQVTDPSGAAVVKGAVETTYVADQTSRNTETDDTGFYAFNQLRPGTYRLKVTKDGFKTFVQDRVTVVIATETRLDVRLEVGAISQQVEVVSAAAPALNTTDATVGNSFDEKEVKDLPFLARNVVSLLTLQPGVVFTGQSGTDEQVLGTTKDLDLREGAVDGVRGNQTNVTLDGVDSNDWEHQSPFTSALLVTLDSVQEFRVTTTNSNANNGLVGGPQVQIVTKSGSNNFHGNARWYYRTAGPTANAFFNNAHSLDRPQLVRNIAGGSLGGHIIKDRLFFFLDDEERRDSSADSITGQIVPTDALRSGVLIYHCGDETQCPGGPVQGLPGTPPVMVPAGAFGLTPANIMQLDPAGIGINPAMVPYMNLFPHGNDPSQARDELNGAGLAFDGFRFNAPVKLAENIYTARVDYNLTHDGRQTVFVRGSLAGAKGTLRPEQFPGQSAASTIFNNSRGVLVQYQDQLSPNFINTARWGFTRQGEFETGTTGPRFAERSFTDILDFANRATGRRVPVHELNDDITWVRGKHNLQFGGVVRFIRNKRHDESLSFPAFFGNNGFCVALCSDAFNALTTDGFPAGASNTSFTRAFMMLTGSITQVCGTFFATPQGTPLAPGTPEIREFAENNFEGYVQDSWKVRSNLTLTGGLRYSYETPPWEVNGVQVAPTVDIMQWFQQRIANMNAGIPSSASPLLSWQLAGKANGKNSWFKPNYKDFGPRLALAYTPQFGGSIGHALFGSAGQSVLRLGAGIFYDRIGQALAVDSDLNGSPGVATFLIDGSQQFSLGTAPRFSGACSVTGCTGAPPFAPFFSPPGSVKFPFTPLANTTNLGFAVDPHLRTPYTTHLTASFQRQLPKNMVLDVAYVGTLGRRLLGKVDFAQYLDIRDPKSHMDLFTAFQKIAALANVTPNNSTPAINPFDPTALAAIQSIPFFDNMLPNMPAFTGAFFGSPFASLTPTQAFYAFAVGFFAPSWSCALFPMDTVSVPTSFTFGAPSPWNTTVDPKGTGFVLFTPQFSSLPGWTNFANSNYHSLQVSLRKNVGFGNFAFNYVFSRSIDNASGTEAGDNNETFGNGTLNSLIQNPFDLRAGRALSDFQLKHNFSGSWVIDLPLGHGHRIGSSANRFEQAVIGGWEVNGVARWRSGFPRSVANGFNFPTNFFLTTPGTITGSLKSDLDQRGLGGSPNLFSDSAAALGQVGFTLPGLSGSRNALIGPAYASMDAGVYKSFGMPWSENQRLQLRFTAFNVFNSVNFDDTTISLDPTSSSTFGRINGTAGQGGFAARGGAREMEFAARFTF